jgi:hypothetical protein
MHGLALRQRLRYNVTGGACRGDWARIQCRIVQGDVMYQILFRCRVRRCLLLALLSPALAMAAPSPSTPQGEPELQLRIVAGEMAGSRDRVLSVAVHANDCVRIHFPDYHKRSGDYAVTLTGRERATLETLHDAQRALPYRQDAMLAEARAIEEAVARGISEPELFAVLDADYVELITRGSDETVATTRALGLFQYAERYPDIPSLKAFSEIAQAMLAISRRGDLVAAGATTEAGR